jgi:hypothetical protein
MATESYMTRFRLEDELYQELNQDFGSAVANEVSDKLDSLCIRLDENDYLDILEYLLGVDIELDDDLLDLIDDIPVPIMSI